MNHLLIVAALFCSTAFGQLIQPAKQHSDTTRIANLYPPVKNMRAVLFGIETGTQFIADSVQLSRLNKKNLFHYGINLQIGDHETRTVFTLIGCDFYITNGYTKTSDTSQVKTTVWGITGNIGLRIPIAVSKLTTINFGPSLLLGRHGVEKTNVNTYGLRLAASVEKQIGTFQCIGYIGAAYDNTGLYKRYTGSGKRNLDQFRIYFGLRF